MADDAPKTAEVEFVEIRGLKGAQPLLLARVQRGGRTYAVRSQLAAAGLVHEKDLRAAAASAEHCCEALGPELVALKGLERAALPPRTARTALVDVRWLADAFAGAPGLDLLQARMLFGGLQPGRPGRPGRRGLRRGHRARGRAPAPPASESRFE